MVQIYETSASNKLVMQHLNHKRRRTFVIIATVISLILIAIVASLVIFKTNREFFSKSFLSFNHLICCLSVFQQPVQGADHLNVNTTMITSGVGEVSPSSVMFTTNSIETTRTRRTTSRPATSTVDEMKESTTELESEIPGEDKTLPTNSDKENETEEASDGMTSESLEKTEETSTSIDETPGSLPFLISQAHSKSDDLSRDLNSLHETINDFQLKFEEIQMKINSLQILLDQVKNLTIS